MKELTNIISKSEKTTITDKHGEIEKSVVEFNKMNHFQYARIRKEIENWKTFADKSTSKRSKYIENSATKCETWLVITSKSKNSTYLKVVREVYK